MKILYFCMPRVSHQQYPFQFDTFFQKRNIAREARLEPVLIVIQKNLIKFLIKNLKAPKNTKFLKN